MVNCLKVKRVPTTRVEFRVEQIAVIDRMTFSVCASHDGSANRPSAEDEKVRRSDCQGQMEMLI